MAGKFVLLLVAISLISLIITPRGSAGDVDAGSDGSLQSMVEAVRDTAWQGVESLYEQIRSKRAARGSRYSSSRLARRYGRRKDSPGRYRYRSRVRDRRRS